MKPPVQVDERTAPMLTATADDADPSHPYGLVPIDAGADPNLALPTSDQLSQQVDR
jgi:hypothetical protein